MRLFDMTEADIQRAEDAYSNRLYNRYYGMDSPERECSNCKFFEGGYCVKSVISDQDSDYVEVDDDDYCDYHKYAESSPPDWVEDEY